jgi:Mg2+ and Co2+ transporter CorA
MAADGHLLLVLHAPPKPDEVQRDGRFFWRAPDGSWTSDDLGTGVNSLITHLEQYEAVIAKLDQQEEKAATANDYFQVIERIAPVQRATRHLHQALQDARKACPEYRELIDLRDRAYDIERTAELLYNGARNSLDFAVAKRAEEQALASHQMAVSAHRLNMLAAFFFPIAALTAIFGVNLTHGLEKQAPPFLFLGLVATGVICGAILASFIVQPKNAGARK